MEHKNLIDYKLIETKMPHIAEKISLLWGKPLFNYRISSLLLEVREEDTLSIGPKRRKRQGFPDDIAKALMNVISIHDELFPPSKIKDVWDDIYNSTAPYKRHDPRKENE